MHALYVRLHVRIYSALLLYICQQMEHDRRVCQQAGLSLQPLWQLMIRTKARERAGGDHCEKSKRVCCGVIIRPEEWDSEPFEGIAVPGLAGEPIL